MSPGRVLLLSAALSWLPRASAQEASTAAVPSVYAAVATAEFERSREATFAAIRARFLEPAPNGDPPALGFTPEQEAAHAAQVAELRALAAQAAFLEKGRSAALDDRQSFADLAVALAKRLKIAPPESVIPLFKGRLRPASSPLTEAERAARDALVAEAALPGSSKRFRFIDDLVGAPPPEPRDETRVIWVRGRHGKRIKKVVKGPELPPVPKEVSVVERIDWEKADELAEVADKNARGWERKPKESLRRYKRRLRRRLARCYEWVRRDLTALGFWDPGLFRGYVPPTKQDRRRPVRAYSFALAMAKIEQSEPLAEKTSLRQLNLRVDPLVRGSIVVFSRSVCGYDARSGHIEIVTSVDPLEAASYKFHPVKLDCLVKASNENKLHIFVPLRSS